MINSEAWRGFRLLRESGPKAVRVHLPDLVSASDNLKEGATSSPIEGELACFAVNLLSERFVFERCAT